MHRERRAPVARRRGVDGSGGERRRIGLDCRGIDKTEERHDGEGQQRGKADDDAERECRQHHARNQAHAPDPEGQLRAADARSHRDERGEGSQQRGVQCEFGAASEAEHKERHDPGAHGEQLGPVACIADNKAHGLPRAQDRAEVQHVTADHLGRFRFPGRDQHRKRDAGQSRARRREQEGAPPAEPLQGATCERIRSRCPAAEACRVESDGAGTRRLVRQTVGEHLEPGHVASGHAGAGDHPPRQGGPETRSRERQPDQGRSRQYGTRDEDITGVDPVGDRGEERNRQHIAAEKCAREPAGRDIVHLPCRLKHGLQRPVG